jgi:hypothetical protein
MPNREIIFVTCLVEANRLYPVLRALTAAKAMNVEVRVADVGESAEAPADAKTATPRGRYRSPTGAFHRVGQAIREAGPDGITTRELIRRFGDLPKSSIYNAVNSSQRAGKIEATEEPERGGKVYRAKPIGANGSGTEALTRTGAALKPATRKAREIVLALLTKQAQVTYKEVVAAIHAGGIHGNKNKIDNIISGMRENGQIRVVSRGVYARGSE